MPNILKVKSNSEANKLAGAIASMLTENNTERNKRKIIKSIQRYKIKNKKIEPAC